VLVRGDRPHREGVMLDLLLPPAEGFLSQLIHQFTIVD